jgi:membrane protease YdiL (CAAX protease family)
LICVASLGLLLLNLALVALPPGWDVVGAIIGTVAAVGLARRRGLSWQAVGLGSGTWASGMRWGGSAVLVVLVFYAASLVLPFTRNITNDVAAPAGASVWVTALLLVPLRTVILEELVFRGILWGFLAGRSGTRWALVGTAVAFGLWHVAPAMSLADRTASPVGITVFAVVVFTFLSGLVLGELRRRSASVLAPAAFHWATNGLGLIAAYLA